ncbi:MAG: hypothetical protein AUJ92_04890 [Armatimonadetes bacterium CG2_30_59_28]|nr:S41 family peptidase [Armatimonadota bacterium]OIO96895.1 MAG: hypothetical protein AUJ92_04890 [Armatimonadetes bacterium CG2_30_59_28]PIU62092.1 MAG: hypothetical protein COS85_19455 [Armatimonadetes bacterium CG07_land_8_20_14_0_80_59_28]PIX43716.1 MAG: hypothetical protein COZ56_06540 [Armatimonadetes bacterium CG_4_8_14_3_um_filter_58_9]PIY42632.1 MAG: hypothetical protein COZ05_13365 [Armatimonadetes bacterium CG_4_10_14_3_um_filter_59_10]PJB73286.1 MAG: hypothetical protein CO095_060
MSKYRVGTVITIAIVACSILGFAFSAGYAVRATEDSRRSNQQVQLPREFLASVKLDPGLRSAKPNLKPFEYLWEVMQAIKLHYVEPKKIDETDLTYGAIRGMVKALGDRYTRFMDPEEFEEFSVRNAGEFEGIGAQLGVGYINEATKEEALMIVAPLPGSPAEKAGIKKGDFILKIDGKSTEDMALEAAVRLIRGPRGTKVVLTIGRKGSKDPFDVPIARDTIEIHPVKSELLENDIGYLLLREFNEKSEKELSEAMASLRTKKIKGLIFDLRNDPGGLLDVAVDVASLFMESGTVVYTKNRSGQEEKLQVNTEKFLGLGIPVVVLINGGSASASEIVAGALQDNKLAHVMGERSFGKASVQLLVRLQNGGALAITTAKYFTPHRRDITDKGIMPDQVVELTEEIYKKDGDIQLKKAIDHLKKEVAAAAGGRNTATTPRPPASRAAASEAPTDYYICIPWASYNT